jgi:hypothetical protein
VKLRTFAANNPANYLLDLRGTSLICEVCNEEHSTKYCLSYYNVSERLLYLFSFCRDSLQDHVSNSHWNSPTWNVSHENPLRRFVIPQDITSHSPFATMSPPPSYSNPSSSQSTSTMINQYPNLVSSAPSPSRAFQVPNFGRLNFSTPGSSSALSSDAILPRSTSSSTMTSASDTRTPMVGFPPSSIPFSHRRPSTSMSSIVSLSLVKHLYFRATLLTRYLFFFLR